MVEGDARGVSWAESQAHGCSTLSDCEQIEEWLNSSEGGAVSVLAARFGAVCHEDVESDAAHAREHAWIGSDA